MDLFNNPMVNNALKAMSPEQLKDYKRMGEYMYGNIDFVDNKVINGLDKSLDESAFYIAEGLKAGLSPSDLDENEVQILTTVYGDEWYRRFGFNRNDVPEMGLSLDMKKRLDEYAEKKQEEENQAELKRMFKFD
jgi:hypothetical protein